jgi:glycosyltransferase involved in cell wall biosynthesis
VPGVSVVVPSYQNARYIRETIDSILAQTYTDFELVVSDHSSTDGTWDIVSSYNDPRLRRWKQPAGGGAPANWNAATARARGQFIKLVCGDDLIAPNSLELQVAALEASPGAVLAASRRRIVDASGEPLISRRGLGPLTLSARWYALVPTSWANQPASLFDGLLWKPPVVGTARIRT